MAPQQRSLLVLGATGFIGGTVLSQLLASDREDIKSLSVTAVVRRESQAEILRANGVKSVVLPGGLDDADGLADLASQHDAVVQAAFGCHPASPEALVRGLARRQEETGASAFYIQVSGTTNFAVSDISPAEVQGGPFSDKDEGIYEYEVARENARPYVQRMLDLKVVQAGEEHGVRTYLVAAPHVYGRGTGLFNRTSQLIPFVCKNAIELGRVEFALPGSSTWGYVHVEDLADLFAVLVARAVGGPRLAAGRSGYFFAETGQYAFLELAGAIARAGHELGAFSSPEPTPVELGELGLRAWGVDDAMSERLFASSAVTKAERAYDIGWRPTKTAEDWNAWIPEEFRIIYQKAEV